MLVFWLLVQAVPLLGLILTGAGLSRSRTNSDLEAFALGLCLCGAAALIVIYGGMVSPVLITPLRVAVAACALIGLIYAIVLRAFPTLDVVLSAALCLVASLALVAWAFHGASTNLLEIASQTWPPHQGVIDSSLPLIFADDVLAGSIPHPMIGDWLGSDRPPLESGLYLLLSVQYGEASYQLLGTTLQMLVIPAVYLQSRALGLARGAAIGIAVAVFFTPLVMVNGILVWPKLLAAAYLLLAGNIVAQRAVSSLGSVVIGACVALAVLAHGGSWFAVPAVGLIALARAWRLSEYSRAGATALALHLPWSYYQRLIDPPGDRLLKWHLAADPNPDGVPFLQALVAAYSRLTPQLWLAIQGDKLAALLRGFALVFVGPLVALSGHAYDVRYAAFDSVAVSPGLLSALSFAAPLLLLSRQLRPHVVVWLVTLVVWFLAIFDKASIYASLTTFTVQIIPLTIALAFVARWRVLFWLLVAAQVAWAVSVFAL